MSNSVFLHGALDLLILRVIREESPLFDDPILAQSALDRLAHNAYQITIEGDSYRGRQRPGLSSEPPPPRRRKTTKNRTPESDDLRMPRGGWVMVVRTAGSSS